MLMVILIWKNVARLFQNVLVQPQIIIACLGTLPLLKNQGVCVWWGGGLWTAVISSAAQWLCNWGNLKRHPYTEIHCLYQQGGKTGEVNQWNVEYGLQSDQEDIHCSSTISVGGYPDFSPLTSPLHRGWVDCIIKCSQISAPPSSPLSGKYVLPVHDATEQNWGISRRRTMGEQGWVLPYSTTPSTHWCIQCSSMLEWLAICCILAHGRLKPIWRWKHQNLLTEVPPRPYHSFQNNMRRGHGTIKRADWPIWATL